MKLLKLLVPLLLPVFFAAQLSAQAPAKPKDYLGVAGPILFDSTSFHLSWTSRPADNYYKQEYIAGGDTVGKYRNLLSIDAIIGKETVQEIVKTMIAALQTMKASDPIADYATFERGDEIILDFLVSQKGPDGVHVYIVERTVYRYKPVVDKAGRKAVVVFGFSERAYGDEIDTFLPALKARRTDGMQKVADFDLPEMVIPRRKSRRRLL
jgi:hypothetical protein